MQNPFKFSRPEKFLIIHVAPEDVRGTLITVDADRRIAVRERFADLSRGRGPGILGRFKGTVIVGADPSLAYTAVVPIAVTRESRKEPLGDVELENLLSQAVGKVFNQCREAASRALGAADLDTVLAGSKVSNFKVDGNQVINPVGFAARRVMAVFDVTLTTRGVLDRIKNIAGLGNAFFFTENGRAELTALQATYGPSAMLIMLRVPRSSYFMVKRAAAGTLVRRGEFRFRPDTPRGLLADAWGVSVPVAEKLYAQYCAQKFSPSLMVSAERIVKPAAQAFLKEIEHQKLSGAIYVDSPSELPFTLPLKRSRYTISEPDRTAILEHFGFTLSKEPDAAHARGFVAELSPFLEFHHDKRDSSVNRWLRRHLHWLGASV